MSRIQALYAGKDSRLLSPVHEMRPRDSGHPTYKIYSLAGLEELKRLVKAKYDKDERLGFYEDDLDKRDGRSIRYLLDKDHVLWFALEGIPGSQNDIPPHRLMFKDGRGQCLCAGNIYFDPSFSHIETVNNKSGAFRPKYQQLYWVLRAIAACSLVLAEKLTVDHQRAVENIEVTANELRTSFEAGDYQQILNSNIKAESFDIVSDVSGSSGAMSPGRKTSFGLFGSPKEMPGAASQAESFDIISDVSDSVGAMSPRRETSLGLFGSPEAMSGAAAKSPPRFKRGLGLDSWINEGVGRFIDRESGMPSEGSVTPPKKRCRSEKLNTSNP